VVSRIGFQQRMPAIGWLFAVFAVLVSFSIVYLGRHWLIDVVAGLAFGYGVARLVAWIRPERFLLLNSLPCADRGMT
jgi:membrane-associated phospholipid phosphatase